VAQGATALNQLGDDVHALGRDVDRVADDLGASWSGNAADAALAYFQRLAVTVADLKEPLSTIADAYDTTATGIKKWGELIADAMGLLLDYLIEIGIAAAATGAFSWTGVGLAIGGAGTAYLAYKATSTWMKVIEYHGYAASIAKGVVGLTAGGLSMLHVDQDLDLPGAYDHPGADR
jgi:uncharacterized protein YukE